VGRAVRRPSTASTRIKETLGVTDFVTDPAERRLTVDRIVSPDGAERPLLEAVSRALRQRGCDDLDRVPVAGRHGGLPHELRRAALAHVDRAEAVPEGQVGRLDAARVAAWITGHYLADTYPAVVLGSAHGGAGHLAAALGAPWLPTSFTITVPWPGGDPGDWITAMEAGAAYADAILSANPDVTVRQVHDPVRRGALCGSTVTLHVRWRRLPPAYRAFLCSVPEPDAPVLLLRDSRTWPVLELTRRHGFQLGSPAGGLSYHDHTMDNPAFRRLMHSIGCEEWPVPLLHTAAQYAEAAGDPELERDLRRTAALAGRRAHRVLYPRPDVLSACVADLYREWLGAAGQDAARCVVETGRLCDPWRVLACGLVPYWCESSSRASVDAAEWWLAGSSAFESVTVLPEPPGTACDAHADAAQWRAVADFAGDRPFLNRQAMGRYPLLPLPTSHASAVLRTELDPARPRPTLDMTHAVTTLRHGGAKLGLLVV
jgi:hypothetical protein